MGVGVHEGTVESIGYVVPPNQLVRDLHPSLPSFRAGEEVFATGFMTGLLEEPCMACLRQHRIGPGEATVGARVDVRHRAPSVRRRDQFRAQLTARVEPGPPVLPLLAVAD